MSFRWRNLTKDYEENNANQRKEADDNEEERKVFSKKGLFSNWGPTKRYFLLASIK